MRRALGNAHGSLSILPAHCRWSSPLTWGPLAIKGPGGNVKVTRTPSLLGSGLQLQVDSLLFVQNWVFCPAGSLQSELGLTVTELAPGLQGILNESEVVIKLMLSSEAQKPSVPQLRTKIAHTSSSGARRVLSWIAI